jgi:hypothetical protein
MTATEQKRFQEERQEVAAKAAAIIAEKKPRTPAEQAALDAVDEQRWVLWHTDAMTDLALAVIRLLSTAGLLRDVEHEKRQAKADKSWTAYSERLRAAEHSAMGRLDALAEAAADRLDDGSDAAEVAKWLREMRAGISETRERKVRGA